VTGIPDIGKKWALSGMPTNRLKTETLFELDRNSRCLFRQIGITAAALSCL
jgi:hypothetical protein